MYEMYPDAWTASEERRQPQPETERPRRRARKTHSVLPAVLTSEMPAPRPVSR
jgi:hypothetical protein